MTLEEAGRTGDDRIFADLWDEILKSKPETN